MAKIEEGMEVLTEMAPGHRNGDGTFQAGTVFAQLKDRLTKMARMMKGFE